VSKYSSTSHGIALLNNSGSHALGSSMLECRVYTKGKIGKDDFLGGTKEEAIQSLLAEGAAASGGLYIFTLNESFRR
jgi:hypothetical protein